MSVALPKASVAFGSVTPPQDDIVDLLVHLGCSTEVSSFEVTLQNWDKKYSNGGTYPIVRGSAATISLGRDPDCPLLLTGIVEETDPKSRAVDHYLIVRGRCNGEQLFRKQVNKAWQDVKGEVVVKYIIDNYTSLSHVRDSVELIEDTDTTYTCLDFEDTPVFDIIKYVAETADLAGAIGFDFRIAPDGKFEFFPKNNKESSVDLTEKLEVGENKQSIARIKNKITVYGAPERSDPLDRDEWTEPEEDPPENWVAVSSDTEIEVELSPTKIGAKHVMASRLVYGTCQFYRSIPSKKLIKNSCLKFWYYHNFDLDSIKVRLRAPDDTNYFEVTITDKGSIQWHDVEVATGKGTEYDAESNPNGIWTKHGAASWNDIQAIEFVVTRAGGVVVFHVDGMHFDRLRWSYTAEDATSQSQYGIREREPEVDEELHSNDECQYRAEALLDYLKSEIAVPSVESSVIDYGTTPILAADVIHVELPNENVDEDERIIAIEYRANSEELKITIELTQTRLLYADFIYGFRRSIKKLDKYKASATGTTVVGGTTSGSGMVQHGNEWHTPDMALASELATHEADPDIHHNQIHGNEDHEVNYEDSANRGTANGYAPLDSYTKVPAANMPSGIIKTTKAFAVVGTLTTGTDKAPTILAPCTLTIVKVKLVVKTAPTGQAIIVDVNKNGTTIFTTQANRPQIAAGATTGDSGTPDVTALAEGDKLTIDIDQVGSGTAGADLTVEVVCNQTVVFS